MAETNEPPEEPLPPHKRAPSTADMAQAEEIQKVLDTALENWFQGRMRRKLGGVDITTMFIAIHNFHGVMVMRWAMQIFPGDASGQKKFYANARDTFSRWANRMIEQIAEVELKSAINEAEGKYKEPD